MMNIPYISSLDKQSQIYQQLSNYLNELSQLKEQLNLFASTNRSNQQGFSFRSFRFSQFFFFRISDQQQRSSLVMDSYEEALAKANLDFTKQ